VEDAMQCERCGADIPEESSFCGQCGAPKPAQATVRDAAPEAQPDQQAAAEPVVIETPAQPTGTSGRSTGRTCLWIGLGCAGFVVIMLCVGLAIAFPLVNSMLEGVDFTEIEALATAMIEFSELEDLEQELLEPAATPEPTEAPTPDVCFNTICFFYDYPLTDTFHKAHIAIYPVAEFLEVNPPAEETVVELEAFLALKPEDPDKVPLVLPIFNAAQMITVQVEYLTFEDGSGVRFVSQYGQAAWPINNSDLFYAYQGLTDDGMYLISAILPVSHLSLPADGDTFIGDEYDAFINAYEAYLLDVESQLALESPLSFFPQLTDLDAMMESMQIESP
jgi:hypothetical protein